MEKGVADYLAGLSPSRRERAEVIRKAFLGAVDDVVETMRYRMPTYEKGPSWAAIGSQKYYLSVYFCSGEIIDNIRKKHPGLSTGKGCVRIRDRQEVPTRDLAASFRKAMNRKKPGRAGSNAGVRK